MLVIGKILGDDSRSDNLGLLGHARLTNVQAENRRRTLYILPGSENRCSFRFNYLCKFWFYIRCNVLAAFPNVKMLGTEAIAIEEFKTQAKDGDIALFVWRSKKHMEVPRGLLELLSWREEQYQGRRRPHIRVGVFHTANEVNRTDWPWYSKPDFILRNYWIPNMPHHTTYIPLGPQVPNACRPRSTDPSKSGVSSFSRICRCDGLRLTPASRRPYLWSFSGSLREKREELVERLQQSDTLKNKGFLHVAGKFGGDGAIGSVHSDPKNAYLESVMQSQFVFSPCGNVMETHRIYEALALGAIPVIEKCESENSSFFPFHELLIDGGPAGMLRFVEKYAGRPAEIDLLQLRISRWWQEYVLEIAYNVSAGVSKHVPPMLRTSP